MIEFPANLTPAERRAVEALCEYGARKVAADKLDIQLCTMNDHLQRAYHKAGVQCAVRLAVLFIRATEVAR